MGGLSYVFVVGFQCFNMLFKNFAAISPEFQQNSPEIHQKFTGSPEFRQNFDLEHLKKGDNHNSAFPQTPVY